MSKKPASPVSRYLKLIPGLLISAFFLWRTLRGFHLSELRGMHFGHSAWFVALLVFIGVDYGLRGWRWWLMLRRYNAKYTACFRVLLTSLAANNILPFRIGDFMRIFAYAPDVNAPSSAVLSTVILERLLDVVMLLAFLVAAISGIESRFTSLSFHGHGIMATAKLALLGAGLCLCLLLFGTQLLHRVVQTLVARFSGHPRMAKAAAWSERLFDAVLHISLPVRFLLLLITAVVWGFEVMVFYSSAQMLSLDTFRGSFLAGSLSNLSFLLPSAPGGIGPFEASSKLAMESQGVSTSAAVLYALFTHFLIFVLINIVGGIGFLMRRKERGALSIPLSADLDMLPDDPDVTEAN